MTPQSPTEALQPEAAPPPPPKPPSRRRSTLSTISGFLSFLAIVALGVLAAVTWGRSHLGDAGPLPTDKVVFIEPHTDLADIIATLENEGVIDSRWLFQTTLVLEGKSGKVKSGEYMFRQHASMRSVIDEMVAGKHIAHSITIPEGLTSAQVVERLRENPMLVGDIREVPKEGSLLPETYKFARGYSRNDLIIKMQEDDRKAVEQIWMRRSPDLPLRSPYDLVTLASIVEKETGKADERPRVAGVFVNRLEKHMRLQSDPTIVYGLVAGQGTLGHPITRSELDRKTPYNTYQIDGLPPGPIDNPGRAALEAVANPSRTQDLYFVADGTGGHAFAVTVDQHNRNVQRWRQIEREAKGKADVDKLSPNAIQAPRGNQRSDAGGGDVFGALPQSVGTTSLGRQAAFIESDASRRVAALVAAETIAVPASVAAQPGAAASAAPSSGNGLDGVGFSMGAARQTASDLLDGPTTPEPPPVATAFAHGLSGAPAPVEQGAARAGGKPSIDAPSDHPVNLFADPADEVPVSSQPRKTPPAHPKIFDVSEGTPLDPLKDHTYDLNSGKTIPADIQN